MTNAEYYDCSYHLDISQLHRNKNKIINAKFDTGANSTIFTLGALYDNIADETVVNFKKNIQQKSDIITSNFISASNTKQHFLYFFPLPHGQDHLDIL